MKKIVLMLVLTCLISSSYSGATIDALTLSSEEVETIETNSNVGPSLALNAASAVLIDADSGTVIFEKNSNEKLPPASITKVMTMLLVMEAVGQGKIKLTDMVRTSANAASMGGSQIFLEEGEEMSVEEMLKGVAMASGNDASVALAEKLGGTEEEFVKLMNERAKQLGMNNTHFMNSNGLPVENHYSSAYDIALVSRELMKYDLIRQFTGKYQDYLRKDSEKPFWLVNTNKLVRFYPGADGVKTGYTSEAKFCLSASAARDGMRVIAVVMGAPNTKVRNSDVSQMMDYAFAQYSNHVVIEKGATIGSLEIEKGMESRVDLAAEQPFSILIRRGSDTSKIYYEVDMDKSIKAPIVAGQPIGKLTIYQGEQAMKEFELLAPRTVEKVNWFRLLKRSTQSLFK
ncbi:D-alanyl-D-alanine carboxypeptidase family protein [Paenibacillus endoradicis]|uniref:D-alanyl-D-alanine carboxypeptidase family protein n=1 Tax=Paenibacillus endoradicis TaxID=2972487 RepID=UPI002158FED7|nr:D-alanyl-D-alanine carboxypeptidase family protein [Paenibacillus endoradicis]MCR8660356.1 D-alanyl-D-alanine carboxypeptidase [Paenibacillus endoradicis]